MRKKQGKKSALILVLLTLATFALIFPLGVVGALAQDIDGDGFIDTVETAGIALPTNMSLAAYQTIRILPKCDANSNNPRGMCVDPATDDLFVIIKRASSGSNISLPPYDAPKLDPLGLIYPGLGVATHELQFVGTSTSQAIGGHYAVMVVENLATSGTLMGFSTFGVPYSGSAATVWTGVIKKWINDNCNKACFTNKSGVTTCYGPNTSGVSSFTCKNSNSGTSVNMKSPEPELINKLGGEFIQNIINHEVSHLIHLASGTGTSDHHYPIAKGVVMEQFIDVKATKDRSLNINVIFYISTQYSTADDLAYQLH